MIRQNRIPHTDMTRHSLVKTPLGKNPVRRCEMLFAIEPLLLEGVEFGVRPDLEGTAIFSAAEGAVDFVGLGFGLECAGGERVGFEMSVGGGVGGGGLGDCYWCHCCARGFLFGRLMRGFVWRSELE